MVSHGSPQKKLRTISCSSASETEADPSENQTQDDILMKRPPPVHRVAVLNEVARSVDITLICITVAQNISRILTILLKEMKR